MNEEQTVVPGASLKLTDAERQVIRDAWRLAGGVTYSAPTGTMAAMAEHKLLAFLAPFNVTGAAPAAHGVAKADMNRLDQVESELFHLIKAVCPGLDTGDLMADAATARAAMASDKPIAFFQGEAGDDGVTRYQNVQDEFQSDADVFPLYRRAPTLAELAAHIDQHQVAASGDVVDSVPAQTGPKGTKQKASSK